MKISTIAARLRKVAFDMDVVAEEQDYDWPDKMVLPLITSAFTDDKWLETLERCASEIPREPPSSG